MKALLIMLVLSGCTQQQRKIGFGVSATTLLAIDWAQTPKNVESCIEGNPVLGTCGGGVPAPVYFPLAMIAVAALTYYTHETVPAVVTGLEMSAVATNYSYWRGKQ